MNRQQLNGTWTKVKGQIQQQFSHLSDADIRDINGKYDKLVGKLRAHYGYSQQEAEKKIKQFSAKANSRIKSKAHKASTKVIRVARTINSQAKRSPWTIATVTSLAALMLGAYATRRMR